MIELIQACTPNMQVPVAHSIIKTESGFNQFAIGVNKGSQVRQPRNYQEAVTTAKWLLANGANIDMGFSQINSSNLRWLGLSVEQVFQPCANLQAMQTVYQNCYSKAGNTGLGTRMQRAFSCYNTGNMTRGFSNGYVNRVTNNFNSFADNSTIKYQQYPAIQKTKIAVTAVATRPSTQSAKKNFLVSVKPIVEETKENITQSNTTQLTNTQLAKEQPVKVFLTWDVFKDF